MGNRDYIPDYIANGWKMKYCTVDLPNEIPDILKRMSAEFHILFVDAYIDDDNNFQLIYGIKKK